MEPREATAWGLVAFLALLTLSSFTGSGTGLFGWGMMVAMAWIWVLLPTLAVVLLVLLMQDREHRA